MTCVTEHLSCVEQWYGRCVLVSDIVRAVFKSVCLSTCLDVGFSNEILYFCTNELEIKNRKIKKVLLHKVGGYCCNEAVALVTLIRLLFR